MGKVVQFKNSLPESKSSLYSKALLKRSEQNGVDYAKLYFGDPEEKAREKDALVKLHKKQTLTSWILEG